MLYKQELIHKKDKMNTDPQTEEDFDAVFNTLKRAKEEGLDIEVIVFAMRAIQADPTLSISQACSEGLWEWDI